MTEQAKYYVAIDDDDGVSRWGTNPGRLTEAMVENDEVGAVYPSSQALVDYLSLKSGTVPFPTVVVDGGVAKLAQADAEWFENTYATVCSDNDDLSWRCPTSTEYDWALEDHEI